MSKRKPFLIVLFWDFYIQPGFIKVAITTKLFPGFIEFNVSH